MKTMTCNQLGGACEHAFHAETFEEMAQMSKQHGMEMFEKGDEAHLDAMKKMRATMGAPGAMDAWYAERKKEFDALPDN
jgi:hypothetical protein